MKVNALEVTWMRIKKLTPFADAETADDILLCVVRTWSSFPKNKMMLMEMETQQA